MLLYDPQQRITAIEALCHPFFDEIRDPNTRLPNDQPLPPVLNFSRHGEWLLLKRITLSCTHLSLFVELSIRPDLIRRLVPPHCEQELLSRNIDIHHFDPIPTEQLKIYI